MIIVNGKLILKEPVIHGAIIQDIDRKSNNVEFRKIPILNKESGQFIEIPAISGNSIKNSTRRVFLSEIFEKLGITEETGVPLDVEYLFFAGGTTSNAKPIPPSYDKFVNLRNVLPFLDLLGGSYKGHFFRAQLIVSFALPALKETIALYPEANIEIPKEKLSTAAELSAIMTQYPVGYTKTALEGSKEGLDADEKGQMIYFFEAMPIGTILSHSFSLRPGTKELTRSCFYAFLQTFITKVKLGGASSKGHGSFEAHYYEEDTELTSDILTEKAALFWDYIKKEKEDISKAILQIPEVLQAKEKEEGSKKKKK